MKKLDLYETLNLFNFFENYFVADNNYSVLFLLAISSLNVYGIILGG
jgi:NADH:ubiquinone oxidoreductase subunit H